MTRCDSQGRAARLFGRSTQSLVKGSDFGFQVQIIDKPGNDPAQIETFSGATAFFTKEDDTALAVTGSLESADRGLLEFAVPGASSEDLLAQDDATIQIALADSEGTVFYRQIGTDVPSFPIIDQASFE